MAMRSTQQAGDKGGGHLAATPLLSLGNAARQEMLLERLPFMAHIARRKRCTFGSMRIKDLDRIVSFQGIGSGAVAESDDDGDDDVHGAGEGESWATDRPTEEGTPRKKAQRQGGGLGTILNRSKVKEEAEEEGLVTGGLPIQSLVLSDDDIEDD